LRGVERKIQSRDFYAAHRALTRGERALGDALGFPAMTDFAPRGLKICHHDDDGGAAVDLDQRIFSPTPHH